ncbi:hypothetical protein BDV27DRAFT_132567 [Aspergillus caelatus]|uniref:Uncharacterized protein n=1 Tax=Aspergillus caelatus TaxID=61420 RepID=A0A5N6ZVT8_9EURO|nr:uncharacterized protein BDV27DRAFT_132567 [Aspergillus caelatus]KAE8361721.1 hypothetical protein BDV27DRAFT_132567 [Aspergillus caelatus]
MTFGRTATGICGQPVHIGLYLGVIGKGQGASSIKLQCSVIQLLPRQLAGKQKRHRRKHKGINHEVRISQPHARLTAAIFEINQSSDRPSNAWLKSPSCYCACETKDNSSLSFTQTIHFSYRGISIIQDRVMKQFIRPCNGVTMIDFISM